jgi:hypothetical protein
VNPEKRPPHDATHQERGGEVQAARVEERLAELAQVHRARAVLVEDLEGPPQPSGARRWSETVRGARRALSVGRAVFVSWAGRLCLSVGRGVSVG